MLRLVNTTEGRLVIVLVIVCAILSAASSQFLTLANFSNLLAASAVNLIFAVGLVVVLIAGGIDISFAVAASVVQYVTFYALEAVGGGNWAWASCSRAFSASCWARSTQP
jgi:simple sugar transport system permease protein